MAVRRSTTISPADFARATVRNSKLVPVSSPWRHVLLRGDTHGFAERPAVGSDAIAVGYSLQRSSPGPTPVVDVLDIDGSPGFTIRHEAVGREIETCEPKLADGIVRAAVYEHDVELLVYAAFTDGTLLPRTSLGCDPPIYGGDLGSKLRTQIEPCPGGGFVITYCYRARDYFVGHHRDGDDDPVWTAPEWMIAATRDHVICAVAHPLREQAEALACRRKLDGAVAWTHDPAMVDVAATTAASVLLVDRTDRYVEKRSSDAATMGRFDELTEAEVTRALDASPTAPTQLRLVDAATGEERWQREVAGDVFAARASDDGLVSWMTTDAEGHGQLWTDRAPNPIAVRGHVSASWPPNIGREPVVVGHVDGRIVWADEAHLHVVDPAAPERAVSLPLPTSIGGFHPRRRDRALAKANAAIAAGHVYLREGKHLWIAPLP